MLSKFERNRFLGEIITKFRIDTGERDTTLSDNQKKDIKFLERMTRNEALKKVKEIKEDKFKLLNKLSTEFNLKIKEQRKNNGDLVKIQAYKYDFKILEDLQKFLEADENFTK